jgi:hypothetical protein
MGRASRVVLVVILLTAGVGIVDGALEPSWDLVALFAVVALLAAGLLVARPRQHHRETTLRDDLALELERRASRSGEPVEQVTDRAVATYLDALSDPPAAPRP